MCRVGPHKNTVHTESEGMAHATQLPAISRERAPRALNPVMSGGGTAYFDCESQHLAPLEWASTYNRGSLQFCCHKLEPCISRFFPADGTHGCYSCSSLLCSFSLFRHHELV